MKNFHFWVHCPLKFKTFHCELQNMRKSNKVCLKYVKPCKLFAHWIAFHALKVSSQQKIFADIHSHSFKRVIHIHSHIRDLGGEVFCFVTVGYDFKTWNCQIFKSVKEQLDWLTFRLCKHWIWIDRRTRIPFHLQTYVQIHHRTVWECFCYPKARRDSQRFNIMNWIWISVHGFFLQAKHWWW